MAQDQTVDPNDLPRIWTRAEIETIATEAAVKAARLAAEANLAVQREQRILRG